jgi:ribonuclease P protein component
VLPAGHRLTSAEEFRTAVRRGHRAGGHTLVLHLSVDPAPAAPPRVGFVVAKAVGPAVVRNRVKRRLRHLVRDRLPELPEASLLVVRARPEAAGATYRELDADLGRCLGRILGRVA